jgi:transcriptional regulator with XRE-family HTH domain
MSYLQAGTPATVENIRIAQAIFRITNTSIAHELGVTSQLISMYLSGSRKPSADMLLRIARIINARSGQPIFNVEFVPADSETGSNESLVGKGVH